MLYHSARFNQPNICYLPEWSKDSSGSGWKTGGRLGSNKEARRWRGWGNLLSQSLWSKMKRAQSWERPKTSTETERQSGNWTSCACSEGPARAGCRWTQKAVNKKQYIQWSGPASHTEGQLASGSAEGCHFSVGPTQGPPFDIRNRQNYLLSLAAAVASSSFSFHLPTA